MQNFNTTFNKFVAVIANTIDKHAPQKRLSRKQEKMRNKPWLTNDILDSIRKCRSMFKSHFLSGTDTERAYFRKYSNKLIREIVSVKKHYSATTFENNKHNIKKMWNIIKSLLPSKLNKSPSANLNSRNMNSAKESKSIANHFNNFFCTIGKTVAENIPDDKHNSYLLFLRKRISKSIFLRPPSMNEVVNSINSLNVNKAVGLSTMFH